MYVCMGGGKMVYQGIPGLMPIGYPGYYSFYTHDHRPSEPSYDVSLGPHLQSLAIT